MFKNSSIFLVVCFLMVSCYKTKIEAPIQNNTLLKETIHNFLDDWHKAAAEANYGNYFGKMDSISVFIGTDASENWTKTAFENFSKPYFDIGKAWSFKAIERNVYTNVSQDFVWFDELLDTWMGTCRGSGVLEKVDKNWKLKHYVLSIAIPNDDIQAVIAAKKKNDSIFLSRFKK